jgi:hypothetical protein
MKYLISLVLCLLATNSSYAQNIIYNNSQYAAPLVVYQQTNPVWIQATETRSVVIPVYPVVVYPVPIFYYSRFVENYSYDDRCCLKRIFTPPNYYQNYSHYYNR